MAYRAVLDHPKFLRLKTALSLTKYETLGVLETLWHFTGRYAPQGNLGRFTDEEIELWLEWRGRRGALMRALLEARWVDPDREHRLLVHDWHQYAPDAVRIALKRAGEPFLSRQCRERCRDTVATNSDTVPNSVPNDVPDSVLDAVLDDVATNSDTVGTTLTSTLTNTYCVKEHEELFLNASSEPKNASGSELPAAAVLPCLHTKRDQNDYTVTAEQIAEWSHTFTAVDVLQELRVMYSWLKANPVRKKTHSGMPRFIHNWLSKAQNQGGRHATPESDSPHPRGNGAYESIGEHNRRVAQEIERRTAAAQAGKPTTH